MTNLNYFFLKYPSDLLSETENLTIKQTQQSRHIKNYIIHVKVVVGSMWCSLTAYQIQEKYVVGGLGNSHCINQL